MNYVTISRYWRRPHIEVEVTTKKLELRMAMTDFRAALVEELGAPWSWMTKKQLDAKLQTAIDKVVEKVKQESAKVMR